MGQDDNKNCNVKNLDENILLKLTNSILIFGAGLIPSAVHI